MTELSELAVGLKDADGGNGPISWGEAEICEGSPWKASAPGVVFDIPCRPFGAFALQIVGTFAGQAGSLEQTLDGANWFQTTGMPSFGAANSGTGLSAPAPNSGNSGGATLTIYPLFGVRVRYRVAALSSGVMSFFGAFLAQRVPVWTSVSGVAGDGTTLGGFPVRIGGRAVSTMPAAAANGQNVDVLTSLDRRLVTIPLAIPEVTWSAAAGAGGITNTTAVTLKAAGAAGIRNYLRSLQLRNVSAVESEVVIRDGAAGTVLWRGDLPASAPTPENIVFDPPLRGSAATLLEVAALTTATKTYINAQGFQGA